LKDFHEAFTEKNSKFLSSHILCEYCKEAGSIWKYYGKDGLRPDHLHKLLNGYKIKSERDQTGKQRGFYAHQFGEVWKRVLKLDSPDTLDALDTFSEVGRGVHTEGVPMSKKASSPSNPSTDDNDKGAPLSCSVPHTDRDSSKRVPICSLDRPGFIDDTSTTERLQRFLSDQSERRCEN